MLFHRHVTRLLAANGMLLIALVVLVLVAPLYLEERRAHQLRAAHRQTG